MNPRRRQSRRKRRRMDEPQPFDPIRHRRGGRRKKAPADLRSEKVYFRLTPDELAAVKAKLDEARLYSVSEYARRMVRDGKIKPTYSRHCDPWLWVQVHLLLYKLKDCLNAAAAQGFPPEAVKAIEDAARETSALMHKLIMQGEEAESEPDSGEP